MGALISGWTWFYRLLKLGHKNTSTLCCIFGNNFYSHYKLRVSSASTAQIFIIFELQFVAPDLHFGKVALEALQFADIICKINVLKYKINCLLHSEHPGTLWWRFLVSSVCATVTLIFSSALGEFYLSYMYSADQNRFNDFIIIIKLYKIED